MKRVLAKLARVRRAFASGFWCAWLEMPPAYAREITVVVDDRKMQDVLQNIMRAEISEANLRMPPPRFHS